MNYFIGTKEVLATKMTLGYYNKLRGWQMPENEYPSTMGYLVEYLEGGEANHPDFKGYISWSPADVFENSYKENGKLTFGDAVFALKKGRRVQRSGWNGKNMFLFLLPAGTIPISAIHDPHLRSVIIQELSDGGNKLMPENATFEALGSIRMWTADKKVLTGWLASQTDILSEDWVILD